MLHVKKINFVSLLLIAAVSLTACHPKVEPASDMDKQLSCVELHDEIHRVKDVKKSIEKNRGFSLRNVGLGLIFWPGIIVNEVTGVSAESEANARLVALQNAYVGKQCTLQDDAAVANTTSREKGDTLKAKT